jgi:peptidoglycan/LPS O-acetylase OafA/YrhL
MGQQRGWGQLRGRGPGALAVLAVMLLAGSGLVAVLAGYRLPVVASRPSRVILALLGGVLLAGATQRFLGGRSQGRHQPDNLVQLLVGLSVLCAAVSLLLAPAD